MTDTQYQLLRLEVRHLAQKLDWALARITELESTTHHIENYLEEVTTDEQ